jgi:hypothetical protein
MQVPRGVVNLLVDAIHLLLQACDNTNPTIRALILSILEILGRGG